MAKRLLITFLCAAAAASPVLAASPALAAQPDDDSKQPATRVELQKYLDARFAAMDGNKDGTLSRAEIAAAHQKLLDTAAKLMASAAEKEFTATDTNKDGKITSAEIEAAAPPGRKAEVPKVLARLDANKDGGITLAEFRAAAGTPRAGSVDDFLKKFDGNKSGSVTRSEYVGPALSRFDALDANKDGKITDNERAKAGGR